MKSPASQRSQPQRAPDTKRDPAVSKAAAPTLPTSPTAPLSQDAAQISDRFWFGATAILVLGIALRQWALGEASFHPDEAIHAYFAGGFAGYHYDPVYHGPLLYHLVAAVFGVSGKLFYLVHHVESNGQFDFTARLVPSLLGIGLLVMVIGPLRQYIGNRGALASAALLAVSPSVVTYSRRLLHDSLVLFLTMGAVLCFLSALQNPANTPRGRQARIGIAAFLTLFLATKANCFFIAAMLLAFYVGWRGVGWIQIPIAVSKWLPLLLFLVVTGVAIAYPVSFVEIPGSDPPLKMETLDHRVFKYVAVSACALFGFWLWTRPRQHAAIEEAIEKVVAAPLQPIASPVQPTGKKRKKAAATATATATATAVVEAEKAAPVTAPTASEEVAPAAKPSEADSPEADSPEADSPEADSPEVDSPEVDSPEVDSPEVDSPEVDSPEVDVWLTYVLALGTALWLYVFLFGNGAQIVSQWVSTHHFPSETFKSGGQNARLALGQMLGYWGGQQAQPRLPGRHDYYLVLMLLYEVPILIAALGGIWHASKHRSAFSDLLLWWAFSSWTVYALANEKVPWLVVHTILPFALLGGLWLGQVRWKKPVFALGVATGLLFCLRGVSGVNFERGGDNVEPLLYAQTPESFRDTLRGALQQTLGDKRTVWMASDGTKGDRQWPTVWYTGASSLYMDGSTASIGGTPDPKQTRAIVTNETDWIPFQKAGWKATTVDFLIWPRASWAAIQPQRYFRWFWARQAMPQNERNLPQDQWKYSILAGKGEWSHATTIISASPNPVR